MNQNTFKNLIDIMSLIYDINTPPPHTHTNAVFVIYFFLNANLPMTAAEQPISNLLVVWAEYKSLNVNSFL